MKLRYDIEILKTKYDTRIDILKKCNSIKKGKGKACYICILILFIYWISWQIKIFFLEILLLKDCGFYGYQETYAIHFTEQIEPDAICVTYTEKNFTKPKKIFLIKNNYLFKYLQSN